MDVVSGIGSRSERESCGNIQLPSTLNTYASPVWVGGACETDMITSDSKVRILHYQFCIGKLVTTS